MTSRRHRFPRPTGSLRTLLGRTGPDTADCAALLEPEQGAEPWWVEVVPTEVTHGSGWDTRRVEREWLFDAAAARAVADDDGAPAAQRATAAAELDAGALVRRKVGPSVADMR